MFSRLQIVFFIVLAIFQINTLLASGFKPNKGETCSPRGPSETENHDDDPCFKDGLYGSSDVRLTKRDGVAVGHTQHVEIEEGKTLVLTTRSLRPLLFEIPEFLSNEECDHIVGLAEKKGLEESGILSSNLPEITREGINKTLTENQMQIYCKRVKRYDSNNDDEISVHEFVNFVYHITKMIVRLNDLLLVYNSLIPDGGSAVTYENCTKLNRTSFVEFMFQLFNMKRFPYYNVRYSKQAWIRLENKDPVLKRLTNRLAALAQMSIQQIEESEDLQVVKYMPGGHYHAHYDSTEDDTGINKKCCAKYLNNNNGTCHLCRYITVLFYLNNVTEGGETAFPVADDEEKLQSKNYSTNLSNSCKKSNHLVQPVKGNAIFWYNHAIDEQTGKMGGMDKFSLHGGCDVLEGEKWIANMWINAPYADQVV